MGWLFSKRPPHPLDAGALRGLETRALSGDHKGVAAELRAARESRGSVPAVIYLEALVYHEASGASPEELLAHLQPAVTAAEGAHFPEARLLQARLLGAVGRLGEASASLETLAREKLPPPLLTRVQAALATARRELRPEARQAIADEAEALAAELARVDLVVRWRTSDLARLDSILDERPEVPAAKREAWLALLGEIACRALGGALRPAFRSEDRVVQIGSGTWSPGRALRDRLAKPAPLYASLLAAAGRPDAQDIAGVPGIPIYVEPGAHLAVVADHVARAAVASGATGLAVFRERPTQDGRVILPVSFMDKGGVLRVVYIETRPWEPERVGELRRWLGRLRVSGAQDAAVSLVAAFEPPPLVHDLIEGREGHMIAGLGMPVADAPGARAATPRSIDEPKLRWLDQKAEMMERLVCASLGGASASDLELLKKVQHTVLLSYRSTQELAPKQWNALYGYGALYGRLLARSFGGRWSALADDRSPSEWEMLLPWGQVVKPVGRVLLLAQSGLVEGDLVAHYLEVKAACDASTRR